MNTETLEIEKLDNKAVIAEIQKLSTERKTRHDAALATVQKAWKEYTDWREKEYRPLREKLIAQLGNNRDARVLALEAKRAEREEARKMKEAEKAAKAATAETAETPAVAAVA